MDEMTQLRELRADAPVPDRPALAPGRERLTDAIAAGTAGPAGCGPTGGSPRSARRPRSPRRL